MAIANPNLAYHIAVMAGNRKSPMAYTEGLPGCAKSATLYALGESMERRVLLMIGSTMDPTDVAGIPFIVKNDQGEEFVRMTPREFVTLAWKQPCIVFLDELPSTPHSVFASMLTMVQDYRIGDHRLPDNLIFAAAGNPLEISAAGNSFPPAMANRMFHHKWKLDSKAVINGFMAGCQFDPPNVTPLPINWESHIPMAGGMIGAFLDKFPNHLMAWPNDALHQTRAWPSPRSWEYAIRLWAAGTAAQADQGVLEELVSGCVGTGPAVELFEYLDKLDIPNVEEILDAAIAAHAKGSTSFKYVHPKRNDQVLAMLAKLNSLIVANPTKERWEAACNVMMRVSDEPNCFETVMACCKPLATCAPPKALPPARFAQVMWPKIKRALIEQ